MLDSKYVGLNPDLNYNLELTILILPVSRLEIAIIADPPSSPYQQSATKVTSSDDH